MYVSVLAMPLAAVRRLPFLRNLPPGALIRAHFKEAPPSHAFLFTHAGKALLWECVCIVT